MTVLVLASLNVDLIVAVATRPGGGQTVLGGDLVVRPGGKGGNQAVAAALAGAQVRVVGRVGDDAHAEALCAALQATGIDTSKVRTSPGVATGVALILVTPDGENSIVVAPGANAMVSDSDAADASMDGVGVAVAQLELPHATVTTFARRCASTGTRFVLNAAPARTLEGELLTVCDPLVVNAHEAAALTGQPLARSLEAAAGAADALQRRGCRSVVLTMGGEGAVVRDSSGCWRLAAPPVAKVVDTTGAGDCLVGTLAARLDAGDSLRRAAADAVRTASLAVGRPGAQSSYATRSQALAVPLPEPVRLGATPTDPLSSKAP